MIKNKCPGYLVPGTKFSFDYFLSPLLFSPKQGQIGIVFTAQLSYRSPEAFSIQRLFQ